MDQHSISASKAGIASPHSSSSSRGDNRAAMANPWSTTPADVALAPLYKLLKNFESLDQLLAAQLEIANSSSGSTTNGLSMSSSSSGGISSPPGGSPTPGAVPHSTTAATSQILSTLAPDSANHGSVLVRQLRESDKASAIRREKQYDVIAGELFPEMKKSLQLADQTTLLFERLSDSLDVLSDIDTLRRSYNSSYRTNQKIWDEISQENKAKLIQCLRSAVYAIFQLFEAREEKARFVAHEKSLLEMVKRTDILREDIEFDDYYLEDLFDLLQECSNSLELIRLYPAVKSGSGRRIKPGTTPTSLSSIGVK
jgi:hypothetical protein